MQDSYSYWLNNIKDEKITKKLRNLDEKKIKENFSSSLSFGTAGIRGIMELGTNKINELTVCKLASAVGEYLKDKNARSSSALIHEKTASFFLDYLLKL